MQRIRRILDMAKINCKLLSFYKLSLILHIPFYFLPGNADFRLTTTETYCAWAVECELSMVVSVKSETRARRLASTKSLNGYCTIALSRRRPVESRFLGQSPFSARVLRALPWQDQERLPSIDNIPTITIATHINVNRDDIRKFLQYHLSRYGKR